MQVNLTEQEIVKFAYVTKEIIEQSWGATLSNAQINCYIEGFYTLKDLLEQIDREYLQKHSEISDYFLTGKRLINEKDKLQWEKEWQV